MKAKSKKRPIILIFGIILILGGISVYNAGAEYYFEGNVRQFSLLSLVQDTQRLDCDAFNRISVTYDDGLYKTLADGKTGLAPFIDNAVPLDLSTGGIGISEVHFEVALECDGSAMEGTTQVDGQIMSRICGDPAKGGTTCLMGSERRGGEFFPVSFSPVNIQEDQVKVIQTTTYTAESLEQTYNNKFGTIFFKHETYPMLDFSFDHPDAGTFTGSYDGFVLDDKIIAQFGLIENVDPSGKDSQGGQKNPDTASKGLRINWWTPQILDIANNENMITVSVSG